MKNLTSFEPVTRSHMKEIKGGGTGVKAGTCTVFYCNPLNPVGCNGVDCYCGYRDLCYYRA